MKPTIAIRDLKLKNITELREMTEGDMHFEKVSGKDIRDWRIENPDLVEHDEIRYEYNFLSERFIIKCMPTATHDSLQSFFTQTVFGSLVEKVGLLKAHGLVTVGSGTTFTSFEGDWSGLSEKLPDGYVKLSGAEFPVVVCEAGWSETMEELMEDARLWLLNTRGQTKIVIVMCFTETHIRGGTDLESEVSEVETQMGAERRQTEEQLLIESVDESTKLLDLAYRLRDLNDQDKLRIPLIGKLQASLHVYRASEDSKDITELFNTTILPSPPIGSEGLGLREFQITIQDIFGEAVPANMKPMDPITFSLPVLEALVVRSLRDTTWSRANRRAEKLMKEAGVWEERETFAQYKRRRKGGAGGEGRETN